MKKNIFEDRTSVRGGDYASPEIRTLDVQPEGLLCHIAETQDYDWNAFEW